MHKRAPFGAVALAALAVAGCDGGAPAVDASVAPSGRTSAVSLRIDVPNGKPASLTVLAFRAAFSGLAASDVLGVVDPLAVSAPLRDCALRDVGQAAGELTARGDTIELEELGGVGISLAELAGLAIDDDGTICDVVARMIDGLESPSLISAMIFNSAI